MKRLIIFALMISASVSAFGQKNDEKKDKNTNKGIFKIHKNPFYEKIEKESQEYANKKAEDKPRFKVDLTGLDIPKSVNEFKIVPHLKPISQGLTGTCWCFSSTSFLESEIKRTSGKDIDLSELYTVYYEYIEKARRFVRERGASVFGEGSQGNATIRIMKEYGAVPASVFTGKKEGQAHHDHSGLFNELNSYLQGIKARNEWNESLVLETVKSILNHYIGVPPESFVIDGAAYTPKDYLKNVVKLNLDDYVSLLSLKEIPFYKKGSYPAPDNWWKDANYYNVPVEVFMEGVKNGIQSGYTMLLAGDVSEGGYDSENKVAIIPSFDIPSEYINDDARQYRWANGTTGDDHGIHLVGWKQDKEGDYWFLIKDSGSGSQNPPNNGYIFYHEDYVKLKMLAFMIHKDAVKDILNKFSNDETKK